MKKQSIALFSEGGGQLNSITRSRQEFTDISLSHYDNSVKAKPFISLRKAIKCAGFTLAEVLITLGIIGVVAALTLPTLIQSHKKTETISRLKKFYSTMSQAIMLSENENGPAGEWEYVKIRDNDGNLYPAEVRRNETVAFFNKYLKNYLNYTEIVEDAKLLDVTQADQDDAQSYYMLVKLSDGTFAYIKTGECLDIRFDIDGAKGPNEYGRDRYSFLLCPSKSTAYCGGKRAFCPYGNSRHTRDQARQACIDNPPTCTKLLEIDNWEFAKDYPFKI